MKRGARTRKQAHEIAVMRKAGEIVAENLQICRDMAKEGVRTRDIHDEVHRNILEKGAFSSFLGYDNPASGPWFDGVICASVNQEVVHGVPGRRRLQSGDIFSADCAVYLVGNFDEQNEWVPAPAEVMEDLRGRLPGARATMNYIDSLGKYRTYHADAAMTVGVGTVSAEADRLMKVTEECLQVAIEMVKPGTRLSHLSRAIQKHAESNDFNVVRQFVGHGIGQSMHESPQVPNFVGKRPPLRDITLREGDALAIEPMLNVGTYDCDYLADGWTVVTRDGKLSAHFEHSVAATAKGPWVITGAG